MKQTTRDMPTQVSFAKPLIGEESNPGAGGKNNEDALAHFSLPGNDGAPFGYVGIVADGIGEHQAGEQASTSVVQMVKSALLGSSAGDISSQMIAAIKRASQELYDKAATNPAWQGMGTTVAVAAILDSRIKPDVEVERRAVEELQPGDSILLCSDGLTDQVMDEEIKSSVLKNRPQAAVKQ
ncbi:MAG: protein phosphatase 2C domain-containing protein [Chloroflexi bacterium]|nr:protein phosphatase 2C domain-containing protein [Chloroflexota bacterium]